MNQTIRILKGPSTYSASTLLIPEFLLKSFNEKKDKFGSREGLRPSGALFQYVVNHKHRVYNKKSMSDEGKTCYQPEYMKLHRKDFFPNLEDQSSSEVLRIHCCPESSEHMHIYKGFR